MRAATSTTGSNEVLSHFWVACDPVFSATLLVAPHHDQEAPPSSSENVQTVMEIYDADGALTNTAQLSFSNEGVGVFELTPFFGSVKTNAGLCHAHLAVRSTGDVRHSILVRSSAGSWIVPELLAVRPREPNFLPISLANRRDHILAAVNCSEDPAHLLCRVYFGQRTPEVSLTIPGHGVKLLSVESDLLEDQELALPANEVVPSYIRMSLKQSGMVGVQVIERALTVDSTNGEEYRLVG